MTFFITHAEKISSSLSFFHVTISYSGGKSWTRDFRHKIGLAKNYKKNFNAIGPFEINFDFPVASSDLKFSLTATVELHHSEPYYLVCNFHLIDSIKNTDHHSVLPEQEIKRIERNSALVWVHKDSEKESDLSIAIGKGIESNFSNDEITEHLAS